MRTGDRHPKMFVGAGGAARSRFLRSGPPGSTSGDTGGRPPGDNRGYEASPPGDSKGYGSRRWRSPSARPHRHRRYRMSSPRETTAGTGVSPEIFVGADGPDTIAVFAIWPVRADIGGYGGSSPRETTAVSDNLWVAGQPHPFGMIGLIHLDILRRPEGQGFQPRPSRGSRFAVPRPGLLVVSARIHGMPCRYAQRNPVTRWLGSRRHVRKQHTEGRAVPSGRLHRPASRGAGLFHDLLAPRVEGPGIRRRFR